MRVDGRKFAEHHIVWLHVTGQWPGFEIDHKNLDGTDNRFSNLRPTDESGNGANKRLYANNACGLKGAHLHRSGRWRAQIKKKGRVIHLGLFDTADQAHAAYLAAASELHGAFARG